MTREALAQDVSTQDVSIQGAGPAVPPAVRPPTIVFIQYLRGIAPLPVVWAHLSGFWLYSHPRPWAPEQKWVLYLAGPLNLYQDAGHLGVILFFFVSGYIVSYASSRETVRTFSIKRGFRLLPMLWVSVLVVVAARLIDLHVAGAYPIGTNGSSVLDYVRGAFVLDMLTNSKQVNAVTWTLVIELMFYLLTLLVLRLSRRSPASATMVMLAVWAGTAVLVQHLPTVRYLGFFTVYVGFLLLGRCLYLLHRGVVTARVGQSMSLATCVVTGLVYQYVNPGLLQTLNGPANTYVLAFLIFLVFMYAAPERAPWPVRTLSDISYSLYLLHLPVGILTIDLAVHAGLPFTVAFLLAVVAALGAAVLGYRFVERPTMRLARRLL